MKQDRQRLLETQPRAEGKFAPLGPEPLAQVRGIRLPQSVDEVIEAHLPKSEQTAWFRRVITEAVQRELMSRQEQTQSFSQ